MSSLLELATFSPHRLAELLQKSSGDNPSVILVHGAMGAGKSTLVSQLAMQLSLSGAAVSCIGADPGNPQFGIPGAVCAATWQDQTWHWHSTEALCSLDAIRFRLPLVSLVKRLLQRLHGDYIFIDAPGAVRGVGAVELLGGFSDCLSLTTVVTLVKPGMCPSQQDQLNTLKCPVCSMPANAKAKQASSVAVRLERTRQWDGYLVGAKIYDLALTEFSLSGTPPVTSAPLDWQGLQCAVYRGAELLGMGEVLDRRGDSLRVRLQGHPGRGDTVLLRDAHRDAAGLLTTKPGSGSARRSGYLQDYEAEPTASSVSSLYAGTGNIITRLVNGVFGDPLLEVQFRGARDRVLFDLGDASLLSRRVLHKVTDVFITHTHFDHICGFLHLLRARMTGRYPDLRIFGPPGIYDNIMGLVGGFNWDRIGDAGPAFQIIEVCRVENDTNDLLYSTIQAGRPAQHHWQQVRTSDVLVQHPNFTVRCAHLDHGIPVLAFSVRPAARHRIRKEQLERLHLQPGIWIKHLKHHLAADDGEAYITLPNGLRQQVKLLKKQVVDTVPGNKLVYATDFADSPANRAVLTSFAADADLFVCEATFCNADVGQAEMTGHITTQACAEIALAANARRLVPFHFSKRYSDNPARVYTEIRAHCGETKVMECGHFR